MRAWSFDGLGFRVNSHETPRHVQLLALNSEPETLLVNCRIYVSRPLTTNSIGVQSRGVWGVGYNNNIIIII